MGRTARRVDQRAAQALPPRPSHGSRRHFVKDIAMVATQVLRLKVPPVGPGEYRIVKEATRDRPGRPRVVLYGRLRVVG